MTLNQVIWSCRNESVLLPELGSELDSVVKTRVDSWKPYMVLNGLRLVEVDLLELLSQTRPRV